MTEEKILSETNTPPLLPDDIHLSIDEIRQELFRMHNFAVDRDDPALMYVTIMNACLDEQKKLMDAHLNALSAIMAQETGASINATKENVAALAGLMSKLTTDGIKEAAKDIKTFEDLKGKTVGVQIGTTAAAKAKEIEGAKVTTFNNASEAIMDLSTGNSVAVINDRPVTDYILVQQPALAQKTVHLTDQMLSADDFAMVVTKQNAKLQGELNAALKTLKENGEYDKIWKKWFGEAK